MQKPQQQTDPKDGAMSEEDLDEHKYVLFSLAGEQYGARLLEIREVVESLPLKKVPNTIEAFQGVGNLRGRIIGVIDLRISFSLFAPPAERPVLLLFDTDSGPIACIVDRILSVAVISPVDVEKQPNIVSTIPRKYILGIGKIDGMMVTLLDLKSVLSHAELLNVDQSKIQVKAG